jgi:hypothetical protein
VLSGYLNDRKHGSRIVAELHKPSRTHACMYVHVQCFKYMYQITVIQIKREMPLPSSTLRVRMLMNPKSQPHQPSRSEDWGWKKLVSSHVLDVVTCL